MSNSTGDKLRAAATGQSVTTVKDRSFPVLLQEFKPQIAAALPKHINADRMVRVALTCFRQNPKLAECDPKSVFAAVIIGAQIGLEPGVMGQAYLIPYGKECQFVPGWQGLVDLVNRSGRASAWTGAVFEGDEFSYEYGSNPHIHHKPSGNEGGQLTHVYAVGRVKNAEYPVIEVWSVQKVTKHRDRYNKVGQRHYSYKHFEMYGRKCALLQVLKYLPKSIEMSAAISLNHSADMGQVIDIKEAIDGNYLPPPMDQPADDDSLETTAAANLQSATTIEELNAAWTTIKTTYDAASTAVPASLEPIFNERREAIKAAAAAAAKKYAEVKG